MKRAPAVLPPGRSLFSGVPQEQDILGLGVQEEGVGISEIGPCGHQDHHHHTGLVPDAIPCGLGGPFPLLTGGQGAGDVVHQGDPAQQQPAKPPPQGGQAAQHRRDGGLPGVDVFFHGCTSLSYFFLLMMDQK